MYALRSSSAFVCQTWLTCIACACLHSYTLVAQLRAMRNGADFARRQGDSDSVRKYTATANEMESTLEQFWDKDRGYLRVTINGVCF